MSGKWIPVKESLPGTNYIDEYILVTTIDGKTIPVKVLDGINWGRGVWDFDGYNKELDEEPNFYHWSEITAWMPLPDPYTEDKA